jgi:uncharacterized protein (DUF488 family)
MRIFTIGFTKKSAESFFSLLTNSGAKRMVDVRLNNISQLAGFAKKDDLKYFLRAICGMDYLHLPELAPTQQMLDAYKKEKGDWAAYEVQFLDLMRSREVEKSISKDVLSVINGKTSRSSTCKWQVFRLLRRYLPLLRDHSNEILND